MLIGWRAAAVPPTRTVPGIRYWRCRSAASSRSQSESSSMGATMGALSHETSCRPTARSLNDLDPRGQPRLRDGQPERLRRLEVDDERELLGTLDRQVADLGPSEDAIHVAGRLPKH